MSVIVLENETIHYEVLGRGRPVIFLHGWIGSWRYWIPTMQAASQSFRTYALDLWGFGDTTKNPAHYTLSEQASLLKLFSDQMGIGKAALIGHGLGAIAALLYAICCPERVERVMAVSLPLETGMIHERLRQSPPVELIDWLLGRNLPAEPIRSDAPKTDQRAIQVSLSELDHTGIRECLGEIRPACLLVRGQNDPLVQPLRPPIALEFPQAASAITFEQSGHFLMLDESSKFNRLTADFLALPAGASPSQLQLKEEWKRRVR